MSRSELSNSSGEKPCNRLSRRSEHKKQELEPQTEKRTKGDYSYAASDQKSLVTLVIAGDACQHPALEEPPAKDTYKLEQNLR